VVDLTPHNSQRQLVLACNDKILDPCKKWQIMALQSYMLDLLKSADTSMTELIILSDNAKSIVPPRSPLRQFPKHLSCNGLNSGGHRSSFGSLSGCRWSSCDNIAAEWDRLPSAPTRFGQCRTSRFEPGGRDDEEHLAMSRKRLSTSRIQIVRYTERTFTGRRNPEDLSGCDYHQIGMDIDL
jgi:hypothetical protein